jgi:lipid II:glycine glycyltransferase (peptidoglycan interpeptide bridge formation enzyme)
MDLIFHSIPLNDIQPDTWNNYLLQMSEPHVLQTWQWGLLKSEFGWQAFPTIWQDLAGEVVAAALVLVRRIAFKGLTSPLGVMYVPKGPLLRDWQDEHLRWRILDDLGEMGRKHRCIFVKIDPDVRLGIGIPGQPNSVEDALGHLLIDELKRRKWLFSREQIQFRNTIMMDLSGSSDELMAKMKQKTRYNLRIAIKRGVVVRSGTISDLTMLYRMYAETSLRDGFVIREESYYRRVWEIFLKAGMADILIAEVQGEPVAAIVLFRFAGKGWFFYGMSRNVHREKMANYLLQWEAVLRMKAYGCHTYDMWGAPDEFDESNILWGVYRFKEGFGGKVIRHIGAWDLPIRPFAYHLYTNIMPRILNLMRMRGIRHTINEFRGLYLV